MVNKDKTYKEAYDGLTSDEEKREAYNHERLNILRDFRGDDAELTAEHDRQIQDLEEGRLLTAEEDMIGRGFRKRWWKFDKEADGKIPFMARWAYTRISGTGQFISLGVTFSFGPSWGAFVLNLPLVELTVGYVPSPMSL